MAIPIPWTQKRSWPILSFGVSGRQLECLSHMGYEGNFLIQLDALATTRRALSICCSVHSDMHGLQKMTDVVDMALYCTADDSQQCISQWPSHMAESCKSSLS
eukprot:scaffold71702_cov66-Attheya_sp.AAC.2